MTADAATLRILIADDNQDIAESLKLLLDGLGYEAHTVQYGRSGDQRSRRAETRRSSSWISGCPG